MLRRLLALESGEGRVVGFLGLHEFLMLAATTVTATAADALFLEAYPAANLPWVYLTGALLSVAATVGYGRLRARWSAGRVHRFVVVGLAVALVLLRLSDPIFGRWTAFVFLLVTPLYAALTGLERVRLLNATLDPRSARRVLPVVGALGGIGATAGAFLVARMSTHLGTIEMFPVAAGLLVLTLAPARSLGGQAQDLRRAPPAPLKGLLASPYVRLLMGAIFLASVLATLARYQVGAAVQESLAPAEIAPFYGMLYGVLNAVSIVFALFVSRIAITRLGVRFSLLLYPLVMTVAGLAGALAPGLIVAAGTVFLERLLRQNVQRPTRRIATLPLPDPMRVRLAMTEEGILTPAGAMLTSLGILFLALHLPWTAVAVVLVVTTLLLLGVVLGIRRRYAAQLVAALHARTLEVGGEAAESLDLDRSALDLLHRQVASAMPENVALGLELLHGHATPRTVEVVSERWAAWPPWLRVRAVACLTEHTTPGAQPFLEARWGEEGDEVRAALLERGVSTPSDDELERLAGLAGWRVRAAAMRALLASERPADQHRVRSLLDECIASQDPELHRAAARVLPDLDAELDRDTIRSLAKTAPVETLEAVRRRPASELAPLCLDLLAEDVTFRPASRALLAVGSGAVEALLQAGRDPESSARAIEVLGSISTPAARSALFALIDEDDDEIRFRAVKALAARAEAPGESEVEGIRSALDREITSCRDALGAQATSVDEVVREEAKGDATWALERVFLLLSVLDPGRPYRRVFLAYADAEGTARNLAIEAIDTLLPADEKPDVLPLLEGHATSPDDSEGDEDPFRTRLAGALASPGRDPTLDLALLLQRSPVFGAWRIRDLEGLAQLVREADPAPEGPVLVVGDGETIDLAGAVLGASPPTTTHDGGTRVPLGAIYATIAKRPHCARPWLAALAGLIARPPTDTPAITRSQELSLASRRSLKGDTPESDISLWRRIFFLKTSSLLVGLDAEALTAVARISRPVSATKGEFVVREGRTGHHFYLVCAGLLEVLVEDRSVARLAPGDGVGELALLSGERRTGSIRALEASELLALDRTDLLDLLDTHPRLVETFSRTIAKRALPKSSERSS